MKEGDLLNFRFEMCVRILKVPLSSVLCLISSVADVGSKVGFRGVCVSHINTALTSNQKVHKKWPVGPFLYGVLKWCKRAGSCLTA